jgi:peptidylprolyl isomerase
MVKSIRTLLLSLTAALFFSCAHSQKNPQVIIHTSLGDITVMLYNETPLHRDNFLKLVRENYYDSLLFHRVISNFMIQGGDPDSKNAQSGVMLGNGGPGYTLPAEIVYPTHFHKKGAPAAARLGDQANPEKRSSGSQFYIVQGEMVPENMVGMLESNLSQKKQQQAGMNVFNLYQDSLRYYATVRDSVRFFNLRSRAVAEAELAASSVELFTMPQHVKEAYMKLGGTPHLDDDYTVFGEVISGMDVIDRIAALPTDANNRPQNNVTMWMEIVGEKKIKQ